MKKIFALMLALIMVFSLAACDIGTDPGVNGTASGPSQTDNNSGEENDGGDEKQGSNETTQIDDSIPTTGTPVDWPDNAYTKLVPTPDVGGKVLTSGEIGTLFAIELKWSMDQGLAYAQQLQEAGFGEDCVEKYEKYGYIDRTANGVNVQLMDLFGVTSLSIMKAEE